MATFADFRRSFRERFPEVSSHQAHGFSLVAIRLVEWTDDYSYTEWDVRHNGRVTKYRYTLPKDTLAWLLEDAAEVSLDDFLAAAARIEAMLVAVSHDAVFPDSIP